MKHFQGLVYRRAADTRNRGDLFLPRRNDSGRVLMLIHGGGWQALSRASIRGVAIRYRRQGGLCRECLFNGRPPNHDIASGRGSGAPGERCLRPDVIKAIRAFLSDCFR